VGDGVGPRRRIAGLLLAAVLLPAITLAGTQLREHLSFATDVPVYLLVVVVTSVVGGLIPAALSAVAASLLLNYYFVEPLHTFTIDATANVVALLVFLLIAVLVSAVVDLAARRSREAAAARGEAQKLSTFAHSLVRGEQALTVLLDRICESFAPDGVSLLTRGGDSGWSVVASSGTSPPTGWDGTRVSVDGDLVLALSGASLSAEDRRVLADLAAHVVVAYRQQELARAVQPLAESERQRTALLNAVSHDLRTPLAAAKAAVSSLRASEVSWNEDDRRELLATAEQAMDRLSDLVTNLLDLSRLRAGALPVLSVPVGLDDVVARALDHVAGEVRVEVDVPPALPQVVADAGLLERVVANVVQNALRYAPEGRAVRVEGSTVGDLVELRVIDHGPGFPGGRTDTVFRPFQRGDDVSSNGAGVGLGLAIARGLTEAMGGTVRAERTPGGGATLVVALPAAAAP
jgi:two-component system sensor histidine kinase KdpD